MLCASVNKFDATATAKAAQYAQIDRLLRERNSQRSIMRVTGVARMTVAGRIKKSLIGPAAAAPVAAKTGATSAVGGARTRWDVDLCEPQKA